MTKSLPKRCEIPEQYKWKLTDIYPDDSLWEKGIQRSSHKNERFGTTKRHPGRKSKQFIGRSPANRRTVHTGR